ncbi:MAG: hypothetical protein P1U41_10235 [Vicingaceae bacterium]|nr:hypothetical protein [Vicingaceae bacterium]
MKHILILFLGLTLFACETPVVEKIVSKHPNGEKKKVEFFQNIDGKEVLVEEKHFFDDGKFKMGGKFKDGLRDGEWKAYFQNKQLQSEGFFKEGKRFGIAKVYFPNGQLMYEGQYENDKEIGHWKFYNEKGKLVNEKDY